MGTCFNGDSVRRGVLFDLTNKKVSDTPAPSALVDTTNDVKGAVHISDLKYILKRLRSRDISAKGARIYVRTPALNSELNKRLFETLAPFVPLTQMFNPQHK